MRYDGEEHNPKISTFRGAQANDSGILRIKACSITLQRKASTSGAYMIFAENGGSVFLDGDNDSQDNCIIELSGDASCTARASTGSIILTTGSNFTAVVQGEVTGKRYTVVNGGHISIGGKGAEFFPGTEDGTVESATFSWYR